MGRHPNQLSSTGQGCKDVVEAKLQLPKAWVRDFAVLYNLSASCTFSMVHLHLLSFWLVPQIGGDKSWRVLCL